MEVINYVKNNVNLEQQQNLNELNDYMKNYSHLTFQEYKNIKKGVKVEIGTPEDNTVVATVNNNTVKTKKK
jgi:inorganic pyrophosphatase